MDGLGESYPSYSLFQVPINVFGTVPHSIISVAELRVSLLAISVSRKRTEKPDSLLSVANSRQQCSIMVEDI